MEERKVIDKLLERFGKAECARSNYETIWDEISKYVLPDRGDFSVTRVPGARLHRQTYDDTAKHAAQKLASLYSSELTNTATDWFGLRILDKEIKDIPEVKSWLKDSTKIMLDILSSPKNKFPDAMSELYLDYVVYGTGCLFITNNKNKLSFRTFHLSQIFILENFEGVVDTVFRKFKITLRQAIQEYGLESLSAKARDLAKKEQWDQELDFLHVAMPRKDFVKGSKKPSNLPIASYYVDLTHKHMVRESGFHEMPYVVPRFSKISGEVYGTGPAWTSLSTIRRLDVMAKDVLIGTSKQGNPTYIANDESVMLPLNIVPGGVVYGEFLDGGRPPITTIPTGADFRAAMQLMDESRQQINEAFFVDQLTLPKLDRATATEVQTRKSDRLRLLGPQLARFQAEGLGPIIDRVFNIILRAGVLPEAPQILEGRNVEVEYLGPLVKLQRAGENDAIVRAFSKIAPLVQIFPDITDLFKGIETAEVIAENEGYPQKGMNSPLEIDQIRQDRAAQQQEQQAMQQAMQLSEGVKNVGQSGLLDQGLDE